MNRIRRWYPGLLVTALAMTSPADAVLPGTRTPESPAVVDFEGREARADALALQPDGRTVMVGTVRPPGGGDGSSLAVVRVLPDGMPDPSFDGDGRVEISLGADVVLTGGWVGLLPDGRILVVGTAFDDGGETEQGFTLIARLLPDGGFDPGFSLDGRVLLGSSEEAVYCTLPLILDFGGGDGSMRCPALLLDDGSVLLGLQTGALANAVLVKLGPDGAPDATFGEAGRVNVSQALSAAGGAFASTMDLVRGDDGSVVLAGWSTLSAGVTGFSVGLARVRGDGTVDTGFGAGGALPVDGAIAVPYGVRRLRDGGYGLGMTLRTKFATLFAAARFGRDGRVDRTFGNDGLATVIGAPECNDMLGDGDCGSAALHADRAGRMYLIGSVAQPSADGQADSDLAIVRFTAQGQPDGAWGAGGVRRFGNDLVLPPSSFVFREAGLAVARDGAGRLVIAGSARQETPSPGVDNGMSLWKIWTDEGFRDDFE